MSEWREISLGEVIEILHGYAFKGEHFGQGGRTRLITPGNFYEAGGFRDRGESQKSYDAPVPDEYALSPGALVVAMTEQAPGLLGSSGLVPRDGFTWLHNQRIGLVRLRGRTVEERYIYYLFNHPSIRGQISATATGTKVRHTSPGRIQSVKTRIPTVKTQGRVAAVLSAFDELIGINERRIQLLEDLARSLYREWFVRFRFPGHEDGGLEGSAGPLPRGWGVHALQEVAEYSSASVHPSKDPDTVFEHFSIPAFDARRLPERQLGRAIKSGKYRVDADSVLLSKLNPRIERVWFAVPSARPSIASTEFLVWTGAAVSNAWLWCLFGSELFRSWLSGAAGGTSTSHQRVKPRDVMQHQIALAPQDLRSTFDAMVEPALYEVAALRRHNRQLAATRDLLLPRLVAGQLDISDIDLGELLSESAEAA